MSIRKSLFIGVILFVGVLNGAAFAEPTVLEYAKASRLAYRIDPSQMSGAEISNLIDQELPGYTLYDQMSDPTIDNNGVFVGFRAIALKHSGSNQIIIAFRGTEVTKSKMEAVGNLIADFSILTAFTESSADPFSDLSMHASRAFKKFAPKTSLAFWCGNLAYCNREAIGAAASVCASYFGINTESAQEACKKSSEDNSSKKNTAQDFLAKLRMVIQAPMNSINIAAFQKYLFQSVTYANQFTQKVRDQMIKDGLINVPTASYWGYIPYFGKSSAANSQVESENAKIYVTGHSLGGALAQLVVDHPVEKIVTFNAPGISSIYKGKLTKLSLDQKVSNFARESDTVGTFGKHLGLTLIMKDIHECASLKEDLNQFAHEKDDEYPKNALMNQEALAKYNADKSKYDEDRKKLGWGSWLATAAYDSSEPTKPTLLEEKNPYLNPDGESINILAAAQQKYGLAEYYLKTHGIDLWVSDIERMGLENLAK